MVHEPEMLNLDEPTSGVDPLARDRFWELLIDLSRNRGVTIFVSTHFMNEAERCDRISLMDSGRVLATDTPANLVKACGAANLDDAFVSYLQQASGETPSPSSVRSFAGLSVASSGQTQAAPQITKAALFSARRLYAYAEREALELIRDPIRLAFAFLGTALLMIIFGFGITMDVDNTSFATLDFDRTPESRAYISEFADSAYFVEKPPIVDQADLERRMRSGEVHVAIEIPPGFGRDIKRGRDVEVGV